MTEAKIKEEYDSKYSGKTIKVCFGDYDEGTADCYTGKYSGYENGNLVLSGPPSNTVPVHLIGKIDILPSGGRRRKRKSARRRRSSRRGSRRSIRK